MAERIVAETRRTQIVTVALALGAGAIAGTLGSLAASSGAQPPPTVVHEVTREVVVRETTPSVTPAAATPASADAPIARVIPTTGAATTMTAAAVEQARQQTEQQHRDALDAHAREPRDEGWATRMESVALQRYGRASSERGFPGRVAAADCRRTTCAVEVEWESFAEAAASWQSVIHTDVPGCARRIVLTEPDDREAGYRATAILTCTDPADDGDTDDERALREGI